MLENLTPAKRRLNKFRDLVQCRGKWRTMRVSGILVVGKILAVELFTFRENVIRVCVCVCVSVFLGPTVFRDLGRKSRDAIFVVDV